MNDYSGIEQIELTMLLLPPKACRPGLFDVQTQRLQVRNDFHRCHR